MSPPRISLLRQPDLPEAARLVALTLRVSNQPDYGAANVERVASNFRVVPLSRRLRRVSHFGAWERRRLVGMVSLAPDGGVGAFFVHPARQGCGLGHRLLSTVIREAKGAGIPALTLRSSLAAERFYLAHGFVAGDDIWHGDERTIAMRLDLAPAALKPARARARLS
ncbi:GNAT family N-acetyltransferase [Pelagovum pacificum]|uniref:GNAT family N-acetyltransferase n=1 Tax=Pelagovum pacificum TaxID=2588711 RepID=A0A5C5GHB9_9RHOB|nr:GNAT family N-acetyltransferase [Pelagovum pacificum]QQA42684.1 GNAT family N-acetyltransferase [Pelagovum pacificum]TNY34165.1 GNAT family N-acetyltransferase [Pelagovum pacificum]